MFSSVLQFLRLYLPRIIAVFCAWICVCFSVSANFRRISTSRLQNSRELGTGREPKNTQQRNLSSSRVYVPLREDLGKDNLSTDLKYEISRQSVLLKRLMLISYLLYSLCRMNHLFWAKNAAQNCWLSEAWISCKLYTNTAEDFRECSSIKMIPGLKQRLLGVAGQANSDGVQQNSASSSLHHHTGNDGHHQHLTQEVSLSEDEICK
jgi:hypothetical protein